MEWNIVVAVGKIGETGSVEEVRLLATLLLVTYHVIGLPDSGLSLGYPHPLRFFADLFSNFRMPAFAFIAGYIYCLRPPQLESIKPFIAGKLRRLALPGLVAMLVFAFLSTQFERSFSTSLSSLWQLLVFPYAHFWFLQAILILFILIGLVDGAADNRAELPLFALAMLVALSGVSGPNIFSINQALILAPFFTFGMCCFRYRRWLERHAVSIAVFASTLFLASFAISTARYIADPLTSPQHGMFQAMTFGMSLCVLLLIWCPRHQASRRIGAFCFTIYLYHVIGTAAMRIALNGLGVSDLAVHLPLGILAGIALPVAIHLGALRHPALAAIILGIRQKSVAPQAVYGPARYSVG